jgi:hypothetical protein
MTVSTYLYGKAPAALHNKEIDWDSDTICVALCTSSYTPDQTAHDYFDDITNELSTGNGYTAGGGTLSGGTITYSGGTTTIDANDITWGTITGTAHYAIIYDVSAGTATSAQPLIAYVDFGDDVVVSGGNLTITWNASGIAAYAVTLA